MSSNLLVRRVILTRRKNRIAARVLFISVVRTTISRTRAEITRRMTGSDVEVGEQIEDTRVQLRPSLRRRDTNLRSILSTLMIAEDP